MQLSNNIQLMIRNRMTFDKGTISYPYFYDGRRTWIRENIDIPNYLRSRLRAIQSTLSFKWDRWHFCWNVVHSRIGQMPYIIMNVPHPVDERAFEQIRRSIWWSTEGIARQARNMENEEGYAREKIDNDRKEKSKDFARELAYPIMNEMRGNGYSHGGSNFMFPGTGDSKMNVRG